MTTWRRSTKGLVIWTIVMAVAVGFVGLAILSDWSTTCQGLTGSELALCQGGWSTYFGLVGMGMLGAVWLVGFLVFALAWLVGRDNEAAERMQQAPLEQTSGFVVPTSVSGVPLAGTGRRLLAYLFDSVLVGLAIVLIRLAVLERTQADGLVEVALVVAACGYFVLAWRLRCATIGQLAFGLRVIDQTDGSVLAWQVAIIRALVINVWWFPSNLTAVVPDLTNDAVTLLSGAYLLALVWSTAASGTRQGLHDRWAHSVVVGPSERV